MKFQYYNMLHTAPSGKGGLALLCRIRSEERNQEMELRGGESRMIVLRQEVGFSSFGVAKSADSIRIFET